MQPVDQLNLRTALDIQKATQKSHYLPSIGFCPLRDRRRDEDIEYGEDDEIHEGMPVERQPSEESLQLARIPQVQYCFILSHSI